MQRRRRYDYITDLPQSIIETILTKLSLRDAVQTSILSSKWRYKWAALTHLVFNDDCISETRNESLEQFISRFLLVHDGPINRFVLSTAYLDSSLDVHQWLLFLSRKDVRELVLEVEDGTWFKLPCVFSCKKLVRLELFGWGLDLPLSFRGFRYLKHIKFDEVEIAQDALQNLISKCPLLESLNISIYHNNFELTIRAPNLMDLTLHGFKGICFENTPRLVAITVFMTEVISEQFGQSSSCNFDKFLGRVPSLQRLTGHGHFTKYLSIGNTFGKTEMKCQQLKVIELFQVCFDDMKDVMVILRLISNAPNLQQLQIEGLSESSATEAPRLDFWENDRRFDCTFERLKIVKMTNMYGFPYEVRFIRFLLQNSPLLESMSITPSSTRDKLSFLIELTRFPRASPQAQMIFI